jgi:hypothetical protein
MVVSGSPSIPCTDRKVEKGLVAFVYAECLFDGNFLGKDQRYVDMAPE